MKVFEAEYILPLRWNSDEDLEDLTAYLQQISQWMDVTVVDGSCAEIFARHRTCWQDIVRHVPVTFHDGANGKVRGVLTGIKSARHDAIIIADDDVRYTFENLTKVLSTLSTADLVKPQNFFTPLPWHAHWDTARTLLNRSLSSDYPGTYAVRATKLRAVGGYDPNVLFENLELERTIIASGGVVSNRPDVYVARQPPSLSHFLSQRVRQAYDSFAQPLRLLLELAIVPIVLISLRHPTTLAYTAAALIGVAEHGRKKYGGRTIFHPLAALWAPLWVAERGLTVWVAVLLRLTGGVTYGDTRLRKAANSVRALRKKLIDSVQNKSAHRSPTEQRFSTSS